MSNNPFTLLKKIVFSILLVLSALSIVATQNVSSQQFTTSTFVPTTSFYSASYYTETSTGMVTKTDTLQFGKGSDCYFTAISSYSTSEGANTHIGYSVSGPMTMYVLGGGIIAFWFAETTLSSFNGCNISQWRSYIVYAKDITHFSYPVTESVDVNLPGSYGPYGFVIIAPLSDTPPTMTLTVGPVTGAYAVIGTTSIPVTTTLTLFTTLEVPFLQANAEWLAPIAIVVVLALGFLVFKMTSRKMKTG